MHYKEEQAGDVQIIRVDEDRFDSTVSPEFKAELLRLIEAEHIRNILVDLEKVEYVDSSGLGALLFGHRQAKAKSGKLKLLNINPKVSTLIKIAKLEDILEHFTDEKKALDSFK